MKCSLSAEVREHFPGIRVSLLTVQSVAGAQASPRLEREKRALEGSIRRNSVLLSEDGVIARYDRFFKKYEKDYPIKYQIQSIQKGRSIRSQSAVVEAMFMAELKNGFLTAAHDLAALKGQLITTVAQGGEEFTSINGKQHTLKRGDIVTSDEESVVSSVLYGPDQRTRITPGTRQVLYFSYFYFPVDPADIRRHNEDILSYLQPSSSGSVEEEIAIVE
jgi:DNA/RNA-binding domain of Phe-tRNA-synthetase-like protein